MKTDAIIRTLWLFAFVSAAIPADATPFSVVTTPTSAEQGKPIHISLFDSSVASLEAADFWLVFDSNVFSDFSAATGSATTGFSLVAGTPVAAGGSLVEVAVSLATFGAPVDGLAGSLVDVSFLIKPNAALGDSELYFEAKPFSDYAIPSTSGWVTVMAAQVPEPVSAMLLGIGMLALATVFRRRS
ncbi:MAG: hypothetical protein AW11_01138 [Candidatus Accumulibacter regalis]|uniref:PEP-CTERM protein-sorting domain-containing protein n=1 Tax=Accumulibacter regalis TaxID=522306 RepID=A0A011PRC5_ACCRE|nr:PEP-CTERM sorting domain-containing protein [Accumulibacter sp.]EXI89956.1 MAG: hypothetical protein AW11_01138 [Candidatus Accumulibacter regalis]HRE72157.1 PEP-CTERM sorting domain-containing protein [Accumulibacter sp.]